MIQQALLLFICSRFAPLASSFQRPWFSHCRYDNRNWFVYLSWCGVARRNGPATSSVRFDLLASCGCRFVSFSSLSQAIDYRSIDGLLLQLSTLKLIIKLQVAPPRRGETRRGGPAGWDTKPELAPSIDSFDLKLQTQLTDLGTIKPWKLILSRYSLSSLVRVPFARTEKERLGVW